MLLLKRWSGTLEMSIPSISIFSRLSSISRNKHDMIENFPAPVLPTTPMRSPAFTCKTKPLSVNRNPSRYRICAFSNLMSPASGQEKKGLPPLQRRWPPAATRSHSGRFAPSNSSNSQLQRAFRIMESALLLLERFGSTESASGEDALGRNFSLLMKQSRVGRKETDNLTYCFIMN